MAATTTNDAQGRRQSLVLSLLIFALFILGWHLATMRPRFDPTGLSDKQLMTMALPI